MRKTALLMFSLLLALATVATAGNSKKKKKEEEKQGYQFTELKRLPATSVKSQDRAGTLLVLVDHFLSGIGNDASW